MGVTHSAESNKGEGQGPGSTGASRDGSLDASRPLRVFHGPRDLDATAMKYMYSFKEAEEADGGSGKMPRLHHSVSHVSALARSPQWFPLCLLLSGLMLAGGIRMRCMTRRACAIHMRAEESVHCVGLIASLQ